MRISVIITVFNLEKYIESALESVFNQRRKPDEIIVVDDCSTDGSLEILEKYGDKITICKMPENSGVMLAFLKGIEASSGEILSFLDGDDIWYPNKLEEIEKAFSEDDDRVLVTHDYECIDSEGKPRKYNYNLTHDNTSRIVNEAKGDLQVLNKLLRNSILGFKGVWLGSAFCIRKKYFDNVKFKNIIFSTSQPRMLWQDHPSVAFLLIENMDKKVFFIDKILFQYRLFGENSSGKSDNLNSALLTLKKRYENAVFTHAIVSKEPQLLEENTRQKLNIIHCEYLTALYSRKFLTAFRKYFTLSVSYWPAGDIFKESVRFAGVMLLGPSLFLKLKSAN